MRGQLFMTDLMTAIFLFLVIFGVFVIFWNQTLDNQLINLERKDIEIKSSMILSTLIRTEGSPENWEDNSSIDPLVLGLAEGNYNILDNDKVSQFNNMSYNEIKQILNTGGYDFQIKFLNSGITKGSDPSTSTENIIFNRRFALYNNTIVEIELRMWRL